MPRVDLYPGDRIRTRPLAPERQTVVPSADVFGANIGEAVQRTGALIGQAATQALGVGADIIARERTRANELLTTTAERQFNQLFQLNALGTERGQQATRGLLTMQGKEAHDKFDDNLKDWDAQADEIVKQSKTPDQRLLLEGMRDQQRARYVELGMRHASAELAKYETGQVQSLVASNVNLAAAAAATPGGDELVLELLARNDEIIDTQGQKVGLHSPEQQAEAKAKLRSDTHVLVVQKLMSAGQDLAARAYFTRVMEKSATHQPEILEGQAQQLRAKVTANATQAQGMRDAETIWEQYAPRPGDPAPIKSADMLAAARKAADGDKDLYNAIKSDLDDREAALVKQRTAVDNSYLETLYGGYWRETPLAQLKQSAAFQNADESTRSKIISMYEAREQNRAQEARLKRGAYIAEYNFNQFVKEQNGWGKFYSIVDPKVLGPIKDLGKLLELIGDDLSVQQKESVVNQWKQVQSGLAGGAGVTLERDIFTQVAQEALGDWVTLTPGNQTDEQRAALGRALGLVTTAIAQKELEQQTKTGQRRALGPLEQREIAKEVLGRTVMVPGMLWGSNEKRAVLVEQDQVGKMYVPWDRISEEERIIMRDAIKAAPIGAGVVSTRTMRDSEIDQRYRSAMERAYAASLHGAGPEVWVKMLYEAVAAVRGIRQPGSTQVTVPPVPAR